MSRSAFALFVALSVSAALLAQAPPATETRTTSPKPLWTVSAGLASPESAYYHQRSNSVFVSNINGPIFAKDGNG